LSSFSERRKKKQKDKSSSKRLVTTKKVSNQQPLVSNQVIDDVKVSNQTHDSLPDRLGGSIPEELVHDAYEKIALLETRFAKEIHDLAYKLEKLEVDLHEKEFTVVTEDSALTLDTLFSLIKESGDINGQMLRDWCFEQKGKYKKRNEDRYKRIVTALYVFLKDLKLLS
jgi:hypothetical protein